MIDQVKEEIARRRAARRERKEARRKERRVVSVGQLLFLAMFAIGWIYTHDKWVLLFLLWLVAYLLLTRRVLPLAWHNRVAERLKSWERPMRAFHIRLIHGVRPPEMNQEEVVCRNCGTRYEGNFCPRCGQTRKTERYRFSNILHNIAGGFFNIDSGFGRTLLDLLYRPGYLIHDFVRGKRAPYFRPFQLLFVLAALYIMLVQLIDPVALRQTEQGEMEVPQATVDSVLTEIRDDEELNEVISGNLADNWMSRLFEGEQSLSGQVDKLLADHPFLRNVFELLKGWAHGNKAFTILLKLPLLAIGARLSFGWRCFRPHHNLTEHIFIQTFIACQLLWVSMLLLPLSGKAMLDYTFGLPFGCVFAFYCLDFKQLYRLRWKTSFWCTCLLFFNVGLFLLILAIVAVTLSVTFLVSWG